MKNVQITVVAEVPEEYTDKDVQGELEEVFNPYASEIQIKSVEVKELN